MTLVTSDPSEKREFNRRLFSASNISTASVSEAEISVQILKPIAIRGACENVVVLESNPTANELPITIVRRFADDHHGPTIVRT